MELFRIMGKLALDGAEKVTRTLANVTSGGLDVSRTFKANARVLAEHSETLEKLTAKITTQQNKVDLLKRRYADLCLTQGKSSKEAKECAAKIKSLSEELKGNKEKLEKATSAADKFDKSLDKAGSSADKAEGKFSKLGAVFAKIGAAAVTAASGAVLAVGKQALTAYADYEQLVGGVDTLFKESSAKVQEYAANAYKTAGLSANEYMETVTSFSASLLQSLGGDTAAAAEMANLAITDMSDNANKMGTDMASIQNAYNGFAKQNYTMLDNLKLGYGGTKEEMERLIADANALNAVQGKYTEYSIDSYADIVSAIHDVQTEMGITGTTAKEASTTIQGSISSMKSAWGNLLTGIADENADFEGLMGNFVDSLVTVGANIIPRINTIIQGLTQLISSASQTIIPLAVQILLENLPQIIAAGMDLIMALVNGILDNIDLLIDCCLELIDVMVDKLIENLPKLIEGGIKLCVGLATGLIKAIPELLSKVPQLISAIVNGLVTNGIPAILDVGTQLVKGLWNGIANMGKWLSDCVSGFFSGIIGGVKNLLGIHSPSKVFAGIGGFMAEGLGEGFDDQFKAVKKDIEGSMNFEDAEASINVSSNTRQIKHTMPWTPKAQSDNDKSIHLTVIAPDGRELARFIAPYMGAQLQLVRG